MFDTPISDITFDQVILFCQTFPEGVRVEYKQAPVQIPKIISSFANTVGGIWVIGVETDPATNRPQLPLAGMPRFPGLEEQIVQSAQTGIYPAITPAVRVLDVPGHSGRVVAVAKVPESVEAPHAIENSTRVYVRVASTTPPYDLADLDRIEYLLKRRLEPERRREELIARVVTRSCCGQAPHRARVIVAPIYPRGILLPLDTLHERASELAAQQVMEYLKGLRRIHGAVMSSGLTEPRIKHHLEVDTHGIAFFETPVDDLLRVGREEALRHVCLVELLYPVATVLNHVQPLLRGAVTNVLIRYELFGWNGISFLPEFRAGERVLDRRATLERHRCVDPYLAVSVHATLETLPERRVEVLTEIIQQVLWAFDYTNPDLRGLVDWTLRQNRLI